jgi:hypothetical protein
MARNLFVFIFSATIATLLGDGFFASIRSGVLSNRYGTSRRAQKPISYWLGMFVAAFAFIVMASGAVLFGFLIVHELIWGP